MIVTISITSRPHVFHGAIIAGAAIAAVGAGVSAYGTAQNASAVADAAEFAAYMEKQLAKKQLAKLDTLVETKEDKLSNINTILERFEGGAAFGSSDVLKNIRTAQSDFAALGAGDFSSFQDQLDNILKSTLANTYGSGSPEGTFTQLAADTVMNLRQGGLNTALSTGQYLSQESNNLLGAEFGILDQEFENQYMIERNRVSGITGQMMISAQQQGVGTAAAGTAIQQVGQGVTQIGAYFNNMDMANQQLELSRQALAQGQSLSTRPYTFTTPSIAPVPSITPTRSGSYFPEAPSSVSSVTSPISTSSLGDYFNSTGGLQRGEWGNTPFINSSNTFVDLNGNLYTNDTSVLPPLGAIN